MTQVSSTAAHAATALRDAAESTAHTLSGLVGDAHDRLDHFHLPAVNLSGMHAPSMHLPGVHRRPSRARAAAPWIVVAVVIAAIAVAVRRRSAGDTTLRIADDSSHAQAA
jgi:hypothetical protein